MCFGCLDYNGSGEETMPSGYKVPLTAHRAAAMERSCWMAKLRRMRNESRDPGWLSALDTLTAWGKERSKRYSKRPGGLKGRKGV